MLSFTLGRFQLVRELHVRSLFHVSAVGTTCCFVVGLTYSNVACGLRSMIPNKSIRWVLRQPRGESAERLAIRAVVLLRLSSLFTDMPRGAECVGRGVNLTFSGKL